jgi:hypothetical protein
MTKYTAAETAISLVIENMEINHIACNTESIRARVYGWYNNSDVTDPEILAACALEGKDWYPGATYQDMLDAKNYWFPKNLYDEVPIWEIEAIY